MWRNIVEMSIEVSFKQGKRKKKIHACVLVSCEEKLLFPLGLKLSLEGWWVQGTQWQAATTGTVWRFSFSQWLENPVWIHVLLLVVAADSAADHTFIYILLFYQWYNLYMQNGEKMREMLSPFKMKCYVFYDVLPLSCTLIYHITQIY